MKGIIGIVVAVVVVAIAANFVIDLCSGSVSKAYFDERINTIECKIDTLTARLGIVERKIDTLTVKVETIKCNSDTIKTQVRDNSWKLDIIKSDIDAIKDKAVEFRLF